MIKINFFILLIIASSCISKSKNETNYIDAKNILISDYWNLLNHDYKDSILILNKKKYVGCSQRIKFNQNGKILIQSLNKEEFNIFSKNKCEIVTYGTWFLNKSDKTLKLYFKAYTALLTHHYYQRVYSIDSISDEIIKLKKINSLLEHHIIPDEIIN